MYLIFIHTNDEVTCSSLLPGHGSADLFVKFCTCIRC